MKNKPVYALNVCSNFRLPAGDISAQGAKLIINMYKGLNYYNDSGFVIIADNGRITSVDWYKSNGSFDDLPNMAGRCVGFYTGTLRTCKLENTESPSRFAQMLNQRLTEAEL